MYLAVLLGIYLLGMVGTGLAWPATAAAVVSGQQSGGEVSSKAQGQPSVSAARPDASQSPSTNNSAASDSTGKASESTKPKASSQRARNRKKKTPCSNSAAAGTPANTSDAAGARAPSNPCPPPKKVIRNGGSEEPTIQLVGGATGDQASQQRSTEQLTEAADENLRKIAGRQLTTSQQDMANQVKQFIDQSKVAVAAGDLERGHNLAKKAQLLSLELVKP